jgi:hypothetical protein
MLSQWRWGKIVVDHRHLRLQTLLAGPLLFFGLDQLVASAEDATTRQTQANDATVATHPPTMLRAWSLRGLYEKAGLPLALADLYAGWVDRIAPAVLQRLAAGD